MIQQPVEYNAQRVNVYAEAVFPAPIDLRSHVVVGALFGQAGHGALNGPGNAEITKLVISVVGNEDILRLDITVDDIILLAELQRLADVDAQADDITPGHGVLVGIGQQRVQQFHPDQDVPAHTVLMADHGMILITHHICRALEFGHDGEFPDDVLHYAVEIFLCLRSGHALIQRTLKFRIALGHGNDLQCGPIDLAEILALDLINRAEAALAQLVLDDPLFKYSRADAICMIHFCSSHDKLQTQIFDSY